MHICRRSTTSTTLGRRSGRVADRPRLTSWGAGRGAGLVCCERLGGATCYWRSAQTVDGVPAWSVRTEGSEAGWVVLGVGLSSAGVGVGDSRCPCRRLGVRGVWAPSVGHQTPRTSAREMRVGSNVTWTSKTPPTAPPAWSVSSGPSHARGRRPGPRDARWRRERLGRAVIGDVAIRATPVRCPHKQNAEPRPNTFTQRPRPPERGGDRHRAPPIQPRLANGRSARGPGGHSP